MNDFTLLNSLLNKATLVPIDARQAKLKETETGTGSSYHVILKGLPDDTLILKTDKFPSPDKFFDCNNNSGICKRADYVVVNEQKMIFIELKKTKARKNNTKKQLLGAQCVMDYCIAVGRRFFGHDPFLKNAVKKPHFVSIVTKGNSIRKRNTRIWKQSPGKTVRHLNNTPEAMLQLKGGNSLHYGQLLADS